MLELNGVIKTFGGFHAVDGIDMTVADGSITGLIGPNGAGKTTLFNTISGYYRPNGGEIHLDGQRIDGRPPHRVFASGLARTFQIPKPFAEMTVLENVMLVPLNQTGEKFWTNWLSPGRVRADEMAIREKAGEIIEFCGLQRVIGDLANTLSGGQLKLLELARVLMADPKLILLDEPAAGVNPSLMDMLVEKIKTLNARGHAFLIIEHNMDLVMSLCDPVVVMAQGKVIFNGTAVDAKRDTEVQDAYLGDLPT